MTILSNGVETMRPRNCLTSLRTPKKEGRGGGEKSRMDGTRVPIGKMVGSRTPETTKE